MTARLQFIASFVPVLCAALWGVSSMAAAEDKPPGTLLGLQNPYAPELAKRDGAKAVRIITLKKFLNERSLDRAVGYRKEGFTVIFTIFLWHGPTQSRLPAIDSAEWKKTLDEFEAFLRKVGPSIDYISLDNEPVIEVPAADFNADSQGRVPILEWYKALAAHAKRVIRSEEKLSHVKVSSPALQQVEQMSRGRKLAKDDALLDWMDRDPNVDVVDIHVHVRTVKDVEGAVKFIKTRTRKPVIITEWSQAAVMAGWLRKKIRRELAGKWKLEADLTNEAFIKSCYEKPVEEALWNDFVATAPYDPAFMRKAFSVMVKEGVSIACYGAHQQYRNAFFDTKQMLANKTVLPGPDGQPRENFKFSDWYREMAKAYADGTLDDAK